MYCERQEVIFLVQCKQQVHNAVGTTLIAIYNGSPTTVYVNGQVVTMPTSMLQVISRI